MTSVYGVTFVGAREQIKRRLEEKGLITDDTLLFTAACYAAKVSIQLMCLDAGIRLLLLDTLVAPSVSNIHCCLM